MEKVYKAMRNTGAANIAIGIIVIAVGVSRRDCIHYNRCEFIKEKVTDHVLNTGRCEYGTFSAAVCCIKHTAKPQESVTFERRLLYYDSKHYQTSKIRLGTVYSVPDRLDIFFVFCRIFRQSSRRTDRLCI